MAPRKRKPPPIHHPTWGELTARKLKEYQGLAISLTVIGGLLAATWSGLVNIGWNPVVGSTLAEHKAEVDRKIRTGDEEVRAKVVVEIETRMLDVTTKISALQDAVNQRKRDLHRFQLENLEAQDAQITWSQMPQLVSNIAGIERQLQERPGDQWLTQRKSEVENARKNIEARQADIRARIKALREQQ